MPRREPYVARNSNWNGGQKKWRVESGGISQDAYYLRSLMSSSLKRSAVPPAEQRTRSVVIPSNLAI
jgi:hypothetical protein